MARGEVNPDAVGPLADAAAELEQVQPQGVELVGGGGRVGEPATQGVEQPIGGGMEQEAEGVRPEAMVAEPVCLERVLQVLDPVLRGSSRHVPIVQGAGCEAAGG